MKWERQFTREYSLLRWHELLESLLEKDLLKFIPGYKRVNLLVDGSVFPQTVYYQPRGWQREVVIPSKKLCFSPKKWRKFEKTYYSAGGALLKFFKKLKNYNFSSFSNKELSDLLRKSIRKLLPIYGMGIWGIWSIHEWLSLPELIKESLGNLKEEEVSAILTPPKLAEHFREEIALRELNLNNLIAVKKHLEKFSWIPCVDLLEKQWGKSDLVYRQKELKKKGVTIDLRKRKKLLKKYGEIIKKLPLKKREVVRIIHQLVFLKDHRNDLRFYAHFFIKNLYYEIARRSGLKIKELSFLIDQEIIDLLEGKMGLTEIKEKIRQRKEGHLIFKEGKRVEILSGEKAKELRSKIIEELKEEKQAFVGIVAASGKVKGEVIIVKNDNDLKKMKKGKILVAIFTRPHYLSVMRQAKAIITDEGGITSHAAIVSRELNIPCIVNTKIATKVLKDGQLVEVDANKGVVRIIK